MKSILFIIFFLPIASFANTKSTEDRLSLLESKMDDLELNQALNKLNFSGSFLNHYENFSVRRRKDPNSAVGGLLDLDPNNANRDQDTFMPVFMMRAALNFDVTISSKLSFYSTIAMTKYWNNGGRTSRTNGENDNFNSLSGSYGFENSGANFDVAYLSYNNQNSPWSFAIGRMTTNNGPPHNQLDGLGRNGTYPFMAYNVILDGVAAIYDFDNWLKPETHKLKARVFYTPFMTLDTESKYYNFRDEDSSEAVDASSTFVTLLTEYTLKKSPISDSIDLYYAYYTFDGFYDADRQDPSPGDTGVEYEGAASDTIYLGINGVMGTGLNLSYTYSHYQIRGSRISETPSFNHMVTANYKFSNKWNHGHILGFEYFDHDENKVPTDATTIFANKFYNVYSGYGKHLFYTIPVGYSQIVRVGGMQYRSGSSDFYFSDVKEEASIAYATWKVFF